MKQSWVAALMINILIYIDLLKVHFLCESKDSSTQKQTNVDFTSWALHASDGWNNVKLTLHVMLQLDEIHRSQRPFGVIRRGHVYQLSDSRRQSGRKTAGMWHKQAASVLYKSCLVIQCLTVTHINRFASIPKITHKQWWTTEPWCFSCYWGISSDIKETPQCRY